MAQMLMNSATRSNDPVFVVGLGRSGTSLMRSLINSHSSFAIAPEIHFLDHWMAKFRHIDLRRHFDAFWSAFVDGKHFPRLQLDERQTRNAILAGGDPTWERTYRTLLIRHADLLGRPRWGEKTPVYFRHLAQLLAWFPDACVVYLMRDPRGVAASHQAVDAEWANLDPAHVAKSWLQSVRILESWTGNPHVRLFRYEDIVSLPDRSLDALFFFLGEHFDPDLLRQRDEAKGLRPNRAFEPGASISAAHVDRWRERLSQRDLAIIEYVAGGSMERYGYRRISSAPKANTAVRVKTMNARRNVLRMAHGIKEPRAAIDRVSYRLRRWLSNRAQGG